MHTQFTEQIALDAATMQVTRDGYLVANPRVARTGIQLYTGAEMGVPSTPIVRVYRPEDEVFHADAMRSLAHRPITNDHPPEMVSARNWRRYAVGQCGGDVARDGDCIRVPLVLMDESAIAEVRAGKAQLSVGYTSDIRWGEGRTPAGEVYDAIQTSIRANHIALVHAARGGSQLRIGDSIMQDTDETSRLRDEALRVAQDVLAHQRVSDAYDEGVRAMSNAWRGQHNPPPAVIEDDTPARAYHEHKAWLQDAWRSR